MRSPIQRQFKKWIDKLFGTPRPKRRRERTQLGMEALEDRVVFSVNPIVAENQLTGTPQSVWDVPGAGDPTIQGYSTQISVDVGQTVNFKINDVDLAPYQIQIYRVGYYQGDGARLVTTIPASQTKAVDQPAPLFNPSTALVDAGNWSVTASWAVPSTAVSGVYFADVERTDTGGKFMIIFVVRNDAADSQILFITSDETWEAYNTWGGYSLYQYTNNLTGAPGGAPAPGGSGPGFEGAAYQVSYNRPLIDRGTPGGLGDTNSFFYDEFPMVMYLEENGYNVSYATDVDVDDNANLELGHQLVMFVGHDEYWSANQYNNTMNARNAGVNLIFADGNEIFWKTYFSNSMDSTQDPERTLNCYKETHQDAITDKNNPGIWTGSWMDPTFDSVTDPHQPQNQLSGQLFMVNRGPNDVGTPITVPYSDSKLQIWANTSVAQLQPGQVATLGDLELGYEWDEDVDNGYRPAGEIDISSTTESVTQLMVDNGNTYEPGTATNNMTMYRAASGALVFAAGMVQFDWGLSGWHDDGNSALLTPNDTETVPALQQMFVNLLADDYVQPGTLMPGLVPASAPVVTTPPKSSITFPASGTSFPSGVAVTITGTAADTGGGVVAGVEVSTDGGLTWHPATGTTSWSYTWVPSTPGPVTILSRATDDSCNTEIPSDGVNVTVAYQATPSTGLVAAYSFNQSSGTTLTDSTANHNNGTITSGTWVSGGMFGGNALSFNGTNTWVTIPTSSSLNLTTGMTLEAWVKPAAVESVSSIIMKETSGGSVYDLYAYNDGTAPPVTDINIGGASYTTVSQSVLTPGVWYNLAATYNGSVLDLYVNGNLAGSLGTTGNILTSSGVLRIGGDSIWGEYFDGLIDDVRIYNIGLNQAEIRSDMSTPVGGTAESTSPSVTVTGIGGDSVPAGGGGGGTTISGTETITASATDAVAVTQVQYFINGRPLAAPLTNSPYTFNWNTLDVTNGTYKITAEALNGVGLTATSPAVSVIVNNSPVTTPPSVTITVPVSVQPAYASGPTILSAVVSDTIPISGVQFELNGTPIGPVLTTAPYRTTFNFTNTAAGTYNLTAVATDVQGNKGTSTSVSITIDHTAPTVSSTSPAVNSSNVATDSPISITFDKDILPSSLTLTLTDPDGNSIPLILDYDESTYTATYNHNSIALDPLTTYTVTLSAVEDLAGTPIAAPYTFTFSTAEAITNASLFSPDSVPEVASAIDTNANDLGVKFYSDVAGFISGIKFYKGDLNTGTHVGQLWSSSGALLASATFTNETASGWQEVLFSTPVAITANTVYVASYYAPNGGYSDDQGYFTGTGVDSGPLHALAATATSGNGVFSYGTGGLFPTTDFEDSNYWVDVVFNSTDANTPPLVNTVSPEAGETGVNPEATIFATFSKSVQASTISFTLTDQNGNNIPGTMAYDSSSDTATFTPTNDLSSTTTYTATISGAEDLAGNQMLQPYSWSFTVANTTSAPAVYAVTPTAGATNVDKNTTVTAAFSKEVDDDTISFVLTTSSGAVVPSTISYDDEAEVATLTPDASLTAGTTYTATVSGAQDLFGNTMTPVSWSFTVALSTQTESFWNEMGTPSVASSSDSSAQEVGMKFVPDVSGTVDGVMFYKGASDTGTHVGHLWDAQGDLLGSVTFTNETASGWQEALFATPINVTAGLTYVVSYYAPKGGYAYSSGYFGTPLTVGDLTAPSGNNGLFLDAAGGGFPDNSYDSSNYWVDVLFTAVTYTTPPTVTTASPSAGATGVLSSSPIVATFSQDVQPGTFSFTVTDQNHNVIPGTANYDPSTQTATFTPTSALAALTTYTVTISGVENTSGVAMSSSYSWSFTTSQGTSSYTLWGSNATPAVASASDPSPNELGMKFYVDTSGLITGAEFYKGTANTGTHVAHLWNSSGTLLATATFTNETATGWQTVSFSTPVTIQAGTEYIISYYAPNGGYAYTNGYFSSGVDAGPLHAYSNSVAGGQGVYLYGSGGGFPTATYNATNYWVQPIFTAVNTSTPPSVTTESPASGTTGVATSSTISAVFNEAVETGSITMTVTGPNNTSVPGAMTYNPATQTATFTPTSTLSSLTTYTVTVSSAQNTSGVPMASSTSWSFTTSLGTSTYTLWGSNATPAVATASDTNPNEVGMKFYSDVAGLITGAEFYQGSGNTGTQVVHLWDGEGNLLATASYTNQTGTSGWQTVNFSSPVSIQAGTTYVISYYAPNGGYSYTNGYFATSGVSSGPLHAYSNSAGGGQGLYFVGTGGGFPTNSYDATNYWVQPVFTVPNNLTPPTVTDGFPAAGANLVLAGTEISATFSEPIEGSTVNFTVTDPNGNVVSGSVSYDPTTQTATFTPSNPLNTATTYSVTVSGAQNSSGVAMTNASWSFTTLSSVNQLTITNFAGGTFDGTALDDTGGLELAGGFSDDFAGTQLNTQNWETTTWQSNSAVTVSSGVLSVQGAQLLSAPTVTTNAVEGTVSFADNPYQNFGMGTGLSTVGGNYWAIFSTEGSTNALNAWVNSSGTTQSVTIGQIPSGFHDYKVQPTATGFNFYIDGTLATTISITFPANTQTSILLSSYNDTTTPALLAESVQVDSYNSSGTYTSQVINAGQSVAWTQVNFNAVVPTGTTLTINVMIGTLESNGTISWMTLSNVQNGQLLVDQNGNALTGQYIQFSVTMTTNSSNQTPVLDDISFGYGFGTVTGNT